MVEIPHNVDAKPRSHDHWAVFCLVELPFQFGKHPNEHTARDPSTRSHYNDSRSLSVVASKPWGEDRSMRGHWSYPEKVRVEIASPRLSFEGSVALRLGGTGRRVRPVSATTLGASVAMKRETLMTVCQLAGISAAALILPCSLIDLKFDTGFLGMLMPAMLGSVALSLVIAVWTEQEE